MNHTKRVPPELVLRTLLHAERYRLTERAKAQAQHLAPSLTVLTPSQLQGLVNTLAGGPGRRTFQARRIALAQYLAWRTQRTLKSDMLSASAPSQEANWQLLGERITQVIEELETDCRAIVQRIHEEDAMARAADVATQQRVTRWLQQTTVADFVQTLVRLAIVYQQTDSSIDFASTAGETSDAK